VDVTFDRIRRMPLVSAPKYKDVRRVLLKRFPYAVFYHVDDNQITIIAVYHTSRDPRGWQSRTDNES
jgi:toxin ParE1/3/4